MADEAWGEWARSILSDQVHAAVEQLRALAAERGCTLSQLALAWVMGRPGVTSAIIGPRTRAQLEDNLAALEVSLSDEDCQRIDALTVPGGVMYRPG